MPDFAGPNQDGYWITPEEYARLNQQVATWHRLIQQRFVQGSCAGFAIGFLVALLLFTAAQL